MAAIVFRKSVYFIIAVTRLSVQRRSGANSGSENKRVIPMSRLILINDFSEGTRLKHQKNRDTPFNVNFAVLASIGRLATCFAKGPSVISSITNGNGSRSFGEFVFVSVGD